MRCVAADSERAVSSLRCMPGLLCVLAYAATAGPPPPRSSASATVTIEESPRSRVLYFEESGSLITPVSKPLAGSIREALPPLPGKRSKELSTGPPPGRVNPAIASKTKLRSASHVASRGNLLANSSDNMREDGLRLDRRIDTDAFVARLASMRSSERGRHIEETADEVVVSFQNAKAAAQLGWLWLDAKNPANASLWFQRARAWGDRDEEVIRGLTLATLAERNYPAALTIAGELPPNSAIRTNVSRESWVGIGQREYESQQYGGALEAFDRAAAVGELPRYARMLRAWSQLKLDNKAAAPDFVQLYRESPDLESAQGIVAADPSGQLPVDFALTSTEPLASLLRARAAEAAFRSRRYLEARALDPLRWGGLGSPGVLAALATVGRRERTGEEGLGKLSANLAPGLEISIPTGDRGSLSLLTERIRLDAGQRVAAALVGTPATGIVFTSPPVPNRAIVRESNLSLRVERDLVMVASVGGGVQGGVTGARAVGTVEVSALPAWGQTSVKAFIEPVRESILSWTGMIDPYDGSAWGGVRRLGFEARALYLASVPYSAGFRARAERLVGTRVAENHRLAFDASFSRELGLPDFAYSSFGLAMSHDTYKRNLSHYTVGHGGYFSPQSHSKMGLAFDFMTVEGKPWLARGRLSAARVWNRADAAPLLPLEPDGRMYDRSQSKGYDASIRLSGVAQVSPRVQLGVTLGRGISPQFGDKLALLELRVLFEPRRGVVSADLPAVRGE